ncbi:hypothetical protein PILCRDRAFT_821212 [Piloderma croceum F 1598]|uniref:Uncharacterized protein n=1 Tax=Piloderma croceum (strain F 1598) TaxID=765440 RepID=A0A0C3FQ58_PILCF|nr:hypothetical protein PILCRDRAFT_821212 [Piloderma croceum F 1598]
MMRPNALSIHSVRPVQSFHDDRKLHPTHVNDSKTPARAWHVVMLSHQRGSELLQHNVTDILADDCAINRETIRRPRKFSW